MLARLEYFPKSGERGIATVKKKKIFWGILLLFFTLLFRPEPIPAAEIGKGVQITFLGHSAFRLLSPRGTVILIDPFLKDNPQTPAALKEVKKADLILITHGHGDHLGDTLEIAENTNASVVAIAELAGYLLKKGLKNVVAMNKGGTYVFKGIRITMVNASHTSSLTEENQVIYIGEAAGYVIRFENGFAVYHAGDTSVSSDMKIIADLYKPNLAMLPIGSLYTMDPVEAAYATKLIHPQYVVPLHYGTWPLLPGTPEEFSRLLKDQVDVRLLIMKPGDTIE